MSTATLTRSDARAVALVAAGQVREQSAPRVFTVPSTTRPGRSYTVTVGEFAVCTCRSERPCVHITAARLFIDHEARSA